MKSLGQHETMRTIVILFSLPWSILIARVTRCHHGCSCKVHPEVQKTNRLMVYFSVMALMLANVNSIHFRYKMKKLIILTSDSLHAC